MDSFIVMLRATVATEMHVTVHSEREAIERAQRIFESVHGSRVEMVLGEIMSSLMQPLSGGEA